MIILFVLVAIGYLFWFVFQVIGVVLFALGRIAFKLTLYGLKWLGKGCEYLLERLFTGQGHQKI